MSLSDLQARLAAAVTPINERLDALGEVQIALRDQSDASFRDVEVKFGAVTAKVDEVGVGFAKAVHTTEKSREDVHRG